MTVASASAPAPRRSASISARLTLILLPVVIIPLLVMGAAAYLRAQQLVRQQAVAQLASAVAAESGILQEWTGAREDRIALSSQSSAILNPVATLIGAPGAFAARNELIRQVDNVAAAGGQTLFSDVMVVRASNNQILASTRDSDIARIVPGLQNGTLPHDRLATTPVYDDPLFAPGDFALVTSVPMTAASGETDSYLIGVNRGLRLGSLMEQMQVLWEERGGYR
jgi:hypothetical protein